MCDLHFYRCYCGNAWTINEKTASCHSTDMRIRCPDGLCMLVGNPRRPQKRECSACEEVKEILEDTGN